LKKLEKLLQPAGSWSSNAIMHAASPFLGLKVTGLFSIFYSGLFPSMKNLLRDIKNVSLEIAASGTFYMSKV
jgi:hypothetical protein